MLSFLKNRLSATALYRFSIPLSLAMVLYLVFFLQENFSLWNQYKIEKIFYILVYSYLLTISIRLIQESKKWSNKRGWLLSIGSIVLASLSQYGNPYPLHLEQEIYFFLAYLFFLFISPYLCKFTSTNKDFYYFFKKLIFAALVATILALFIFTVLMSLSYLLKFVLNISIPRDSQNFGLFCGLLIMPITFVLLIPLAVNRKDSPSVAGRVFFVAQYLVLPLVGIYLVILYAYLIKIGYQGKFVAGSLKVHIILFFILAIPFYFLMTLHSPASRLFDKIKGIFPYILLGPLLLFLNSLYMRINAQGFTENRYIGLLLGIWFTLCVGYMISKRTLTARFALGTLVIISLVAARGPLSMISTVSRSYTRHFEHILKKHDLLLKNGKIRTDRQKEFLGQENRDGYRIYDIVFWLLKCGQQKRIAHYFPVDNPIHQQRKAPIDIHEHAKKIINILGIETFVTAEDPALTLETWAPMNNGPIYLGKSRYFYEFRASAESNPTDAPSKKQDPFIFSLEGARLHVRLFDQDTLTLSVQDVLGALFPNDNTLRMELQTLRTKFEEIRENSSQKEFPVIHRTIGNRHVWILIHNMKLSIENAQAHTVSEAKPQWAWVSGYMFVE